MSFLSQMFLWALPLVAVPIAIHLIHRRQRQVVGWGAMQLLLEAAPPRRRMRRIEDLLLMLLRAAMVLVLVLLLARPLVQASWLGGPTGRETLLIVDGSLSMARVVGDRSAMDLAKEAAIRRVRNLADGDLLRIAVAGNRLQWLSSLPTAVNAEVRRTWIERISQIEPTLGTTDFPEMLLGAADLEPADESISRTIVLVTDGQAHGWRGEGAGQRVRRKLKSASIPTEVQVVDVLASANEGDMNDGVMGVPNWSLEDMRATPPVIAAQQVSRIVAQVRNTGPVPSKPTIAKWERSGESLGVSTVPALDPQQTVEISIEVTSTGVTAEQSGWMQVRCTLESRDPLAEDNVGRIVLEVVDRVSILVAHGSDDDAAPSDVECFAAALGRDDLSDTISSGDDAEFGAESGGAWRSVFVPTETTFDQLESLDLRSYRAIVLFNPGPLSGEVLERLAAFVSHGGGLWVSLGERARAADFNQRWYQEGEGLAPLRILKPQGDPFDREKFIMIHPPAGQHAAVQLLGDTRRLDVDDVKIYRRYLFEAPEPSQPVSVLLETGDGQPLAVEKLVGRGRVIVQGVPLGLRWSNLPLCQAYVALVHEWLWYLTEPTRASHTLDLGGAVVLRGELPTDAFMVDKHPSITLPGGERLPLLVERAAGQAELRFSGADVPGEYVIRLPLPETYSGHQAAIPYEVRRDPRESDLTRLSKARRDAIAEAAGVRFTRAAADPVLAEMGPTSLRPAWRMLIVLFLVLLAAEIALVCWNAKRRFAVPAG